MSDGDNYVLTRGLAASIRLLAQHFLWRDLFGWNLHPSAKSQWDATTPRRIADVATGNVIWLLEEARALPPGSTATGFDISFAMAPPASTLPANVSLVQLNMAAELPAEYVGVFDVVHVRLLIGAVTHNDPRPILRNLIKMLKPGGTVQWGEVWSGAVMLGEPLDGPPTAVNKIVDDISARTGMFGGGATPDSWLARLPDIFAECGLEHVEFVKGGVPPKERWRYWGEITSGALEEVVAGSGIGREHVEEMTREREAGRAVYAEPRITVGRRPAA